MKRNRKPAPEWPNTPLRKRIEKRELHRREVLEGAAEFGGAMLDWPATKPKAEDAGGRRTG